MLFGMSLSLSKKNNIFLKKCTVNNWGLIHCLPFRLDYLKNFGESPKPARLVMANSEQDPIMAYWFEI